MDETDKRSQLIMSHFGSWIKITPENKEAMRLMNEAAEKLYNFTNEVKHLFEIKEDS